MKDKFGVVTIISLVLTLFGVIAPIAWDYYTGKKSISLTLASHDQIISANTGVEGLEINYRGTNLKTLSRMTFLIENTGSTPISEADVVSPIEIKLSEAANILETIISSKLPNNLELWTTKSRRTVTVKFSLLNPGDKAVLSLLTDSVDINFNASARISGIKALDVNLTPPKTLTPWAIIWIPVGLFSLLLVIVSLVGFTQYPKELKIKRSIKNGNLTIPDFKSYQEAHEWVKKTFSFTTTNERAPVSSLLRNLEESGSELRKETISKSINETIPNSASNLVMALIVFGIGLFGFLYALRSMEYI